MPSPIVIKHAALTTPVTMPAAGLNGEMAFSKGGFTDLAAHAANGNDLIISDGTANSVLVGPTRQVELIGNQTIAGLKTFGLANLSITGGTVGQFLSTDGAGVLSWGTAQTGTGGITSVATDGVTINGDGLPGTPVALISAIFTGANSGLTYAPGAVTVAQATQTVFGGLMIATAAGITAGTDDVTALSPLGLRSQFGADIATLNTTVKTVVPAINELFAEIVALSNVLVLGGAYNVATNIVSSGAVVLPDGPLPVAAPANNGYYVIVTVGGTGTGNAPAVAMNAGDWLVSNGTTWIHIALAQGTVLASNVEVNPAILGGDDVQEVLTTLAARVVTTDGVSITGDGVTTPITLALVDGGTF